MLESYEHEHNAFVTLTYDDENLPPNNTLEPNVLRDWFKRLRRRVEPLKLRYYAVGEYGHNGTRLWNPHYHVALFNYPPCEYGRPVIIKRGGMAPKPCPCNSCMTIYDTWKLGLTFNAMLEKDSAQYIAQYVTKKLTKKKDKTLEGRYPEFARMSNRDAIGKNAMKKVAKSLIENRVAETLIDDVPDILNHGGQKFPLGRYLKQQLRKELGRSEETPDNVLSDIKLKRAEEIDLLIERYGHQAGIKMIEQQKQRLLNVEAKFKIKRTRTL